MDHLVAVVGVGVVVEIDDLAEGEQGSVDKLVRTSLGFSAEFIVDIFVADGAGVHEVDGAVIYFFDEVFQKGFVDR